MAIKKKKATCGLSYPQTSGRHRRGRTIRSHTRAAEPKYIAKHCLSSEAHAVPPVPPAWAHGWDSLSLPQPPGTARLRQEDTGSTVPAAEVFLLETELQVSPLPASHAQTLPDGRLGAPRSSAFPTQLRSEGQKNHGALLKRSLLPQERAFHPSDRGEPARKTLLPQHRLKARLGRGAIA